MRGAGIGLRPVHVETLLAETPPVPWLEVLADNLLSLDGFSLGGFSTGGRPRRQVQWLRERYPMTLHCIGLSPGSSEPLDQEYLKQLRRLKTELEPAWISDHLCWSSFGGHHSHDLLPLPFTDEALQVVVDKVLRVQDVLQEPILLENVSSYLRFAPADFSEAEFIAELCTRSGCHVLLDLNNVYVNQYNHGIDAVDFIDRLPIERVREIHLAGFDDRGDYLLDAHNNPVADGVWALYKHLLQRRPDIPTLIEWDNDIPALDRLLQEAGRAADLMRRAQVRGEPRHASA